MIEKTAWDVRKYPEKFAAYCILCNFAAVFQNCINSMETKYIHRELSAVIEEAYRYFSVITVTGPRQSGKTTLLRNLFSHLPYYSLENLDVRSFAENDPVAFLNQHTEGMILDEVHNAPNLLSYIQGMVDNDADRRFILSGSSQFAMLKKVTQSLAGRTAVFELLPLSYSEIREQVTDTPLDNLLFNGFYPAIYSGRNIPKFLYPAYMKTYLDKDVRDEVFLRNRPILTRIKDEAPAYYGDKALVEDSLIADGCRIEGTVKNCVLFRDVVVEKGAEICDCIIMEGGRIQSDASLRHVITDRNVVIRDGRTMMGHENYPITIAKNATV